MDGRKGSVRARASRSLAKNPTGGRPRDFHYNGIIGLAFSRLLDPISRRCKVTPAYSRLPRWLCEWPDKRTTTGRRIAGERDVQSLNLRRHPEQWSLLVCLEPRCWSRRGRQRTLVSSSSEFLWIESIHVSASFDSRNENISQMELLGAL